MKKSPLALANRKAVGYIEGDRAVLPVRAVNYFAAKHGYSVDAAVLDAVRAAACRWIVFEVHGKRPRRLMVSVDDFLAHAERVDYGYGVKLIAPDWTYTEVTREKPPTPPTLEGGHHGFRAT